MKKDAEVAWQAGDFGKPLMTHSGQPPEYRCYCGSVATIFENLEAGASIDDILAWLRRIGP